MDGKTIKHYINVLIPFVIMIGAHFVPPFGALTEMGVQVLGVFAGMIYGWFFNGMLWPSLLGIVMLGFTDYTANCFSAVTLFLSNSMVVQMIAAYLVFAFANVTGITNWCANWLVTRKQFAGKPWVFAAFIMAAVYLISSVFNGIVLVLVTWAFLTSCFKEMGMTKEDSYPTFVFGGIALCALCGGSIALPFLPNALTVVALFTSSIGRALTLSEYLSTVTVLTIITILIYFVCGRLTANGQKFIDGVDVILQKNGSDNKLTYNQKVSAAFIAVFLALMILINVLPKSWLITQMLINADMVGVCGILVVLMVCIRDKEGKPMVTFSQLINEVAWDMIFLVGAIMVVATAISSEGTGFMATCAGVVIPLVYKMGYVGFVVVLGIFLAIITQFSMNLVLQLVFAPILAPMVAAMGYNPIPVVLVIYLATNLSYLSPSASMHAGMLFSHELANRKQIYKMAIPWTILGLVILIPLSFLLGGRIIV